MEKLDLRKKYHAFYSPSSSAVQEITAPTLQYAMVDGAGVPEYSEDFQNAIAALYSVTYTLKIGRKRAGIGPDYTIGPMEGLWWMNDGGEFDQSRPQDWRWTLMVMQPDFIGREEFNQAVSDLKGKKSNPALELLRLDTLDEGRVVQIMHIGPYDQEASNIQKLEDYAQAHAETFSGKHHEIYLGDPRRAKPETLRTILRHPVH